MSLSGNGRARRGSEERKGEAEASDLSSTDKAIKATLEILNTYSPQEFAIHIIWLTQAINLRVALREWFEIYDATQENSQMIEITQALLKMTGAYNLNEKNKGNPGRVLGIGSVSRLCKDFIEDTAGGKEVLLDYTEATLKCLELDLKLLKSIKDRVYKFPSIKPTWEGSEMQLAKLPMDALPKIESFNADEIKLVTAFIISHETRFEKLNKLGKKHPQHLLFEKSLPEFTCKAKDERIKAEYEAWEEQQLQEGMMRSFHEMLSQKPHSASSTSALSTSSTSSSTSASFSSASAPPLLPSGGIGVRSATALQEVPETSSSLSQPRKRSH